MSSLFEIFGAVVRPRDIARATGRSRASIYRDVRAGRFPPPIALGPAAVGWRTQDVQRWLDERPHACDARAAERAQCLAARSIAVRRDPALPSSTRNRAWRLPAEPSSARRPGIPAKRSGPSITRKGER